MTETAELLTLREVATMCRVSTETLRKWRLEGDKVPAPICLGKRLLWRRTDIEAMLNRATVAKGA